MIQFVARRLAGSIIATIAALTFVFVAIHIAPGDPVEAALSQSLAPRAVIENRRRALGLDDPLWLQYVHYVVNMSQGNLGVSWANDQPVSLVVGSQLASTGILASAGALVALSIGVGLGILSCEGPLRHLAQSVATLLLTTPAIFLGTILIWVFADLLDWLPATGQQTPGHWILPVLVVGLSAGGAVAKAVETGVSEVRRQPFMRTARAKGLSRGQVTWVHGLRVGLLPAIELVMLQFGYLLGGTVITETIFARQGVGRVLVIAILSKDLPVVQAVVLLSILTYSFLNLLADVLRGWLDPRIRIEFP